MTPYCYLLKFKPEEKFYYGVKYASNSDPETFWKDYFTSSTAIWRLIEEYGLESFEFEIRKTFECQAKAREWERKVIKRMNIVRDDRFLNKHCPGEKFGFKAGEANPMHNKDKRVEIRRKWSEAMEKKYGVNHNSKLDNFRKKSSESMSRTNSEVIECPHCHKRGGHINMKRYHFDNCKKKEEKYESMG